MNINYIQLVLINSWLIIKTLYLFVRIIWRQDSKARNILPSWLWHITQPQLYPRLFRKRGLQWWKMDRREGGWRGWPRLGGGWHCWRSSRYFPGTFFPGYRSPLSGGRLFNNDSTICSHVFRDCFSPVAALSASTPKSMSIEVEVSPETLLCHSAKRNTLKNLLVESHKINY